MRRGGRRFSNAGGGFAAFGVGLLACAILPPKLMVVVLAIALVVCGFSCVKR